ncbi:MAG: HisA/HisF-related TIM barrel protein [Methylohalobius sp.]|nr:HisA/HisF-related TIM barrel protein [Methylohalobius sp.]
MELIPAVDLRQGQVVMAIRGQRDRYLPLKTPLCPDSDPCSVVSALLNLGQFRTLYVADLDAIEREPDNGITISRLGQTFPHLCLWVDRGWPPVKPKLGLIPVVGSESLGPDWRQALAMVQKPWILSLDFNAQGFLGPKDLLQEPKYWPPTVILMTLAKVGSQAGPDWPRLAAFKRQYPHIHWIAAGGVSSPQDLTRLQRLGIGGVLVARALHYGLIRPETDLVSAK